MGESKNRKVEGMRGVWVGRGSEWSEKIKKNRGGKGGGEGGEEEGGGGGGGEGGGGGRVFV